MAKDWFTRMRMHEDRNRCQLGIVMVELIKNKSQDGKILDENREGFNSVKEFARVTGIRYDYVIDMINGKRLSGPGLGLRLLTIIKGLKKGKVGAALPTREDARDFIKLVFLESTAEMTNADKAILEKDIDKLYQSINVSESEN